MVIAVWVIVGLFWAVTAADFFIDRSESRKAWRKQLRERLAFAVFDAVDWVRVHVFRRESWIPPMTLSTAERNAQLVRDFFNHHGIRHLVDAQPDGGVVYKVHQDDLPKLLSVLDSLEQKYGFKKAVSLTKQ